MKLVCNSEWILTKQRVIDKVYQLFGSLSEKMQACVEQYKQQLPAQALQLPPKISKGEQYERMPYVVLDYPRFFSKENVFAVRTFFWWGNYFTSTLHVKGIFLREWYPGILKAAADKKWDGFYFSSEGNEFSFDLGGKNYRLNEGFTEKAVAAKPDGTFLKISRKVSFEEWNTAEQKLLEAFGQFISLSQMV